MLTFYYDGEPLHNQLSGAGVPVLLVKGLGCSGADGRPRDTWRVRSRF